MFKISGFMLASILIMLGFAMFFASPNKKSGTDTITISLLVLSSLWMLVALFGGAL